MKKIYLLIVILFLSCSAQNYFLVKRYFKTGYVGFEYSFSDFGVRNLKIKFLSDSIMEITNHVSYDHAYAHTPTALYFTLKQKYLYQIDTDTFGVIVVKQLIESNKILNEDKYCKPYVGNFHNVSNIFPYINNDTIRLSKDLKKLQILEFSFDFVQ